MVLVSVFFGVSQWIFGARTVHPLKKTQLKLILFFYYIRLTLKLQGKRNDKTIL